MNDLMNNSIAAGIVTYNPDILKLEKNIKAVCCQVDRVYVFDNGSENIEEIKKICGKCTELTACMNNKGIAYALNRLFESAEKDGFVWLLTLDQDSICFPDIIDDYRKHLNEGDSITCLRKDINYDARDVVDYSSKEVDRCITSGNLVRVAAWRRVKGFNERLFIDMVDIDFCFRLRATGGRIIKVGTLGILHEMGDGTSINLLGKMVYIGNYSAFRKYYITRNMVYVIRKYKLKGDYYSYKRIAILFFHALLKEEDKIRRCHSMIKGVYDGFKQYTYLNNYFKTIAP